jgi:hypothetical protein
VGLLLKGLLKMRDRLAPGGLANPPRPGEIMPQFLKDRLTMPPEQQKKLQELQQHADTMLDTILDRAQKVQLKEMRDSFDRGAPGGVARQARPGMILPPFLQEALKLTAPQKKNLDELQRAADAKLEAILTPVQNKQIKNLRETFGTRIPDGSIGPPRPGQLMPPSIQDLLKLTADQKEELARLQKQTDARLDAILAIEQRRRIRGMREGFDRAAGPSGSAPPRYAVGGNALFRAYRYAPDYAGLAGKDLTPGTTLEVRQPLERERKTKAR